MTVVTYDYEGVPAHIRAAAEGHATRIYREIGVDLRWRDATGLGPQRLDGDGTVAVVMAIASRDMTNGKNRPDDVLGTAPRGHEGLGAIAYAYYGRIDDLARLSQNGRVAPILGSVFAHEIGHLLLPPHAHSDTGLMRADWDGQQIVHALRGTLRFTAEQAALIRQRLAAAATN
jgi:hypothetical protein